jgi:hypothetical protein
MTTMRSTDKTSFKITSKVLWSIIGSLLIIMGTLIGRWSSHVDVSLSTNAEACVENKNEIVQLKVILPRLEKFMSTVDIRLLNLERKH